MPAADWAATPPRRARRRRLAVDIYLALRISTLGFTALLPLVGAASAKPGFDAVAAAWQLAVALAFHVFAYMLNDVVDLWVDRTEPLRADAPLVRGAMSQAQACAIALAQVPLAFGLGLAGGAVPRAIAFVAMAVYDLWGKRCRWPLLTDAVQSAGWCALLLAGAEFGGAAAGAATWAIVGYVFLCVMLVNGVHGALRDLANDQARGAHTTAVWFGARAGAGTAVRVPVRLTTYALGLQAGLVISALGALATLDHGSRPLVVATQSAVALSLLAACATLAWAFGRAGQRRSLVAAGAANIVATLLVLPLLVLARLGPLGSAVLLAAFGLPLLAMWAYNGSHWHLAPNPEDRA
jgi:4-hydroxybenzoate polyprenyltransferase